MEKPKRPLNIYFRYMKDNKDRVKENLDEGESYQKAMKKEFE